MAIAAVAAIAVGRATLTHGDPAVVEETSLLCLVCGRHGLTDVVLNVALFLPLGVGLRLAGMRLWKAIVAGALLSLVVESAQYALLSGRSASLSDLIFNTIGTALGAVAVDRWRLLLRPEPRVAMALATIGCVVSLTLLAVSGWALVPSFPPPPYAVNQIASEPGLMRPYEATILRSVFAGREYPPPRRIRGPLQASETRKLDPTHVDAGAEVHPMHPPGMLRPLVLVSAPDSSSLLLLAQRERSLILRLRVRGSSLRLAAPTLALPGAFPANQELPSVGSAEESRALRLHAIHTPGSAELSSEGEAGSVSRIIRRTPLLGWTMLMPFGIAHGTSGDLVTFAWAILLLLPGAYWSGRARPAVSWAPLAQLLVVLSGIAIIARVFSLSTPAGLSLAGVLIATWGGAALGAWTCRRLASPSLAGQVTAS